MDKTIKRRITWDHADNVVRRMPPINFTQNVSQFLVELTPIGHEDDKLEVVEVVVARNEIEAAWFAFQKRNIPWNWLVTEIEFIPDE